MILRPEDDGVTHINVYSKGKTALGRALSNWSPLPGCKLIETRDGLFKTIEGYWAWLGYENPPEWLRGAEGWKAKQAILRMPEVCVSDFEERIRDALWDKCTKFEGDIRKEFINSSLPFAHYYVYGGRAVNAGFEWILEEIESIRRELQDDS